MKFGPLAFALAFALCIRTVYGFPGMAKLMQDLMKRQAPPAVPEPLIGDLATIGARTPVGTAVLNCINGTGACQDLSPKVCTWNVPIYSMDINLNRHTRRLVPWEVFNACWIHAVSGITFYKTCSSYSPLAMEPARPLLAQQSDLPSTMQALGNSVRHTGVLTAAYS
jgi:hypothetical protein